MPHVLASRNRARRSDRSDYARLAIFGGIGVAVFGALFTGAAWLTRQLLSYEEFGDFLLRLGLSWLFVSFLAFLAFSGVVTSLSTFFLADDLRLLLASPVAARRLFLARFTRTVVQASWMVVVFLMPVLLGIGAARGASWLFYATAVLVIAPFSAIPVAVGAAVTLLIVNVFPARRARDVLMLTGLIFAVGLILVFRWSTSPSGCCASSRCPTSPTSSPRCSRRSRRCCRRSGPANRCSPACTAASTCCTGRPCGRRRWRLP